MNALALSGLAQASVALVPEALQERGRIIDRLEAVEVVRDSASNEVAVKITREAAAMLQEVEKTRMFLNGPVLALQRSLNATAKDFCLPLEAAMRRVNEMLSEFASEQRRIAQEAEAKKREELRKAEVERQKLMDAEAERQRKERRLIEQKRVEEIQAAKTKADKLAAENKAREELEAAQTRARFETSMIESEASAKRVEVLAQVPAVVPVRAEGQVTRAPWVFDVVDVQALLKARPDLVTVEASKSAINAAIRLGMRECPGLVIRQEVKAGVRIITR
jgi:hypothetical protein